MQLSNLYFKKLNCYLIIDCKYCDIRHEYVLHPKVVKGFLTKDANEHVGFKNSWNSGTLKDDKIFIFKGCTIPRFKLKERFEKTIIPNRATSCFINPNDLFDVKEIFNIYKNVHRIDFETLRHISFELIDDQSRILINSLLKGINFEEIYITNNVYDTYVNNTDILINQQTLRNFNEIRWGKYSSRNNPSLISINYNNKLTVPIYHQNDFLKIINEVQLVIDKNKYEELRSLALSPDDDNFELMLSIIENSNFDKSFMYLVFLISEFKDKLTTALRNRVGFKSLVNFIGINPRPSKFFSILEPTYALKKRKLFTKDAADELKRIWQHRYEYMNQEVLEYWYKDLSNGLNYKTDKLDIC